MQKQVSIRVDTQKSLGDFDHFWRYIGYDECNYTYIPQGIELLSRFGSLENEPYYVRTHFMFCTGNCHGEYKYGSTNLYTEDTEGNPVYNFDIYDKIIDAYMETGVKPFLELGFMPMDLVDTAYLLEAKNDRKRFAQYKDKGWTCPPRDYDRWCALIEELMLHLKGKYGAAEVESWYFELWNEPDIFYWSGTIAEYCKLFDYTEHALHNVLPGARLGGPGVTNINPGGYAQEFFEYFLKHCKNGVNFYSGATGTRLDYITYHVKGGGFRFTTRAEKEAPSVANLIRCTEYGLELMQKHGYSNLEVVLSEADPDGWAAGGFYDNTNMNFRNTEYYATYTAEAYIRIERLSRKYNISVKPLAWAFMFPGERCFEGTRTFSTQGIGKAVFNLFEMLGKLGHERLEFNSDGAMSLEETEPFTEPKKNISIFDGDESRADVSGFAVRGENDETQILIYSHHDDWEVKGKNQITLTVSGYGDSNGHNVTHYRIDGEHSNAYAEWVGQGRPWYPEGRVYDAIKSRDALERLCEDLTVASVGNQISLQFEMPSHGVSLIIIR